MPLKTKNVFLTGGARGLGKSYVDALLAAGARAVFCDINQDTGAATEKELQDKHGPDKVKFIHCDISNTTQFQETFSSAISFLGYVDLFVNNAAWVHEYKPERMVNVIVTSTIIGTDMASEHMRKDKGGKGGRIINISSILGLEDGFTAPAYCATKQAVRAFTSSLSVSPKVKDKGIEFAVLCPGMVLTDLFVSLNAETLRDTEFMDPKDIEQVIASIERVTEGFMKLVTLDEMNGAILHVDRFVMEFCRLEKVVLGEEWPPKGDKAVLKKGAVDSITQGRRQEYESNQVNN